MIQRSKRILAILCTAVFLISAFPVSVFADEPDIPPADSPKETEEVTLAPESPDTTGPAVEIELAEPEPEPELYNGYTRDELIAWVGQYEPEGGTGDPADEIWKEHVGEPDIDLSWYAPSYPLVLSAPPARETTPEAAKIRLFAAEPRAGNQLICYQVCTFKTKVSFTNRVSGKSYSMFPGLNLCHFTIGGKVAFCLEPGKVLNNTNFSTVNTLADSPYWNSMGKSKQQTVSLIIAFGGTDQSPTTLVAQQLMIWEVMTGWRSDVTGTCTNQAFLNALGDAAYSISEVRTAYNTLNERLTKFLKTPSGMSQLQAKAPTIKMTESGGKYTANIPTGGELDAASLQRYLTGKGISGSAVASGANIVLTLNQAPGDLVFEVHKLDEKYVTAANPADCCIYWDKGNSQNQVMLHGCKPDPKAFYFRLGAEDEPGPDDKPTPKSCKVILHKYGEYEKSDALPGVSFALYKPDGKLKGVYRTNAGGEISVSFSQVNVATKITESGAEVPDNENPIYEYKDVGEWRFLEVDTLSGVQGAQDPPDPYYNDEQEISFYLDAVNGVGVGGDDEELTVEGYNREQYAIVTVQKKDFQRPEMTPIGGTDRGGLTWGDADLTGAEYNLYAGDITKTAAADMTYTEFLKGYAEDGGELPGLDLLEHFAAGKGSTSATAATELRVGVGTPLYYTVVETNAPMGYLLNDTDKLNYVVVPITFDGDHRNPEQHVTTQISDKVKLGKIYGEKHLDKPIDGDPTGEHFVQIPEEGARFEIILKSAIQEGSLDVVNNTYTLKPDYPREKYVSIVTTDALGHFESGWLPYGLYVVRQISGMAGYDMVRMVEQWVDSQGETAEIDGMETVLMSPYRGTQPGNGMGNAQKGEDGSYIGHSTHQDPGGYFLPSTIGQDYEGQIIDGKATTSDKRIYQYIFENKSAKRFLRIEKHDMETGKRVPLADFYFKIWDVTRARWVTDEMRHPDGTKNELWHTSARDEYNQTTGELVLPAGCVSLTDVLETGDYQIFELHSANGYYLNTDPITFTVDENTGNTGTGDMNDVKITVTVYDQPIKGKLVFVKTGEGLVSSELVDGMTKPVYGQIQLGGGTYQIIAAEDIRADDIDRTFRTLADGTPIHKGTIVETITAYRGQPTVSGELYAGQYLLHEATPPAPNYLRTPDIPFTIDDTHNEAFIEANGFPADRGSIVYLTWHNGDTSKDILLVADAGVVLDFYDSSRKLLGSVTVPESGVLHSRSFPTGAAYYARHGKVNTEYDLTNQLTAIQDREIIREPDEKINVYDKDKAFLGDIFFGADGVITYAELTAYGGKRAAYWQREYPNAPLTKIDRTYPVTIYAEKTTQPIEQRFLSMDDARQRVKVDVTKAIDMIRAHEDKAVDYRKIGAQTLSPEDVFSAIVYGLYAGEDLHSMEPGANYGKTVIPKDALIDRITLTPDADGALTAAGSNVQLEDGKIVYCSSDLPVGRYYLQEISTHPAYELDPARYEFAYTGKEDSTHTAPVVTISVNRAANEGNPLENHNAFGGLEIHKTAQGKASGELAGFSFLLTGTSLAGCPVEVRFITDPTGYAYHDGIPVGTYRLEEEISKVSEPYLPFGTSITIPNNTVVSEDISLSIENIPKDSAAVRLIKTAEGLKPGSLDGFEFEVVNDPAYPDTPEFKERIVTDKNGIAETTQPMKGGGHYIVSEVVNEKAKGYTLPAKQYITTKNIADGVTEVKFHNRKPYTPPPYYPPPTPHIPWGKVELLKVDADTKAPLSGAGFLVRDLDGKELTRGETGKDGKVSFLLAPGKYSYEEYQAPGGYMPRPGKWEFEVKEYETVTITFENSKPLPPPAVIPPTPPQTGDANLLIRWMIICGSLACLGFVCVGFILRHDRRKAERKEPRSIVK